MEEIIKAFEEAERREQEEWDNKTNEEKLEYYEKNNPILAKYIRMSKEELEEELRFFEYKKEQLKGSFFHDPYYSYTGCIDSIYDIKKVKELKGWN